MKAFHSDEAVKEKYLNRVIAHQKADNLLRGQGWTNNKGRTLGCTLESYDSTAYETELGIPEWLAKVENTLFGGMYEPKSRTWPEKFLAAIKPGVDLEQVKTPFTIKILERNLRHLDAAEFDAEAYPQIRDVLDRSRKAAIEMIRCHREGADLSGPRLEAKLTAESAWSEARSASRLAWSVESTKSMSDSGQLAMRSAWLAAEAADSAEWSATWLWPDWWSQSARSAWTYDAMADELLLLLGEAR